ncbi:hypothetical protein [uncultured Granulicatella sp.]|uniref:hypothetical protein n=1 Tax=uncultured Granulicatella sp. TaxID=316089 RepID=UPI0028D627F0|nr:hypothetical protein [uncultured Granulicatella sp.]
MNLQAVRKLVKLNLLYAVAPAQLAAYRQKQEKNPLKKIDIPKKILRSQLMIGLIYIAFFGVLNSLVNPIGNNPVLFANMISIFSAFTFSQSFIAFYNVFYESKDLTSYRPYAFREVEIILGKAISVMMVALMGLGPIIAYFIVLPIQYGKDFWYTIPLMIINCFILLVFLGVFIFTLVHYLTSLSVFKKYKNIISNILLGFVSIFSGLLYILISNHNMVSILTKQERAFIPPFEAFYAMILHPLSLDGMIGYIGWIGITVLLLVNIYYKVLPTFYEKAMEVSSIQQYSKRVRSFTLDNFSKLVRKYHIQLIKEGSIIVQGIIAPSILPYLMLLPMIFGIMREGIPVREFFTFRFLLSYLLFALLFAVTNSIGNSLTSIGFSLERDNFEYLKVLPIDMKKYAREKFKVLFLTQSSVPILSLSIVLLVLRMPVLLVLTIIFTWFSISFGLSAWGFERDYRLRVTNWSNIVELQSRGNKFLLGFLMFILFMLLILCIAVSFPIIHFLPETIGYLIGAAAFIILNGLGLFFGEFYLRKLKKAL